MSGLWGYNALQTIFHSVQGKAPFSGFNRVFGHWETDNYIGTNKEKAVLSVTTERLTRFTILEKLAGKEAHHKTAALIDRLSRFPDIARKSITADNGFENYGHRTVSDELSVAFYFAHPYSSWEKGTVENTNNRLAGTYPVGRC